MLILSFAFGILCILLGATPLFMISDLTAIQALIGFLSGLMLVVAASAPRAEVDKAIVLLKPLLIALAFPILWMLLQQSPLPGSSLSNSLWKSSASVLTGPLSSHVTIAPGRTLQNLFSYFSLAAVFVVSVLVSRERKRAEITLFALCAVTIFVSAVRLLFRFAPSISVISGADSAPSLPAISALGVLVNAAIVIRAFEQYLSRRDRDVATIGRLVAYLLLGVVGLALCVAAVAPGGPAVVAVTLSGVVVMIFIAIVRRFGMSPVSAVLLFSVVALATGAVLSFSSVLGTSSDALFRFAAGASKESMSLIQRVLPDTSAFGTGVGSFDALASIYRDFGAPPVTEPPSTVALILIEWGRLGLFLMAVFLVQLFVVLFLGAMRRGRDSFYAAMAAGAVLMLTVLSVCASTVSHIQALLVAVILAGLGVSQCMGRTKGP